jgi:hypothetical protein
MNKNINLWCNEIYNSNYIEYWSNDKGYNIKPCCLFNDDKQIFVENINDIQSKVQEMWPTYNHKETCKVCIDKEKLGFSSKRTESLNMGSPEIGLIRFDIRPGNTCNLKCIMCNPKNSSQWYQDIDLWTEFNGNYWKLNRGRDRGNLDWDWIYSNCVDKAVEIYIAGGEPFYMKNVQKFLKDLSNHSWNCENTRVVIQTNGISNTPKFLEILKKYRRLHFSISQDGWGEVNELIRFPTNHDELMVGIQELLDCNPYYFDWNITAQAMNLPNIDFMIQKLKDTFKIDTTLGFLYHLHRLYHPDYLSINSLKPSVINNLNIEEIQLQKILEDYKYNGNNNKKMQKFLLAFDKKRGTNSPKIIPWCFE